MLGYPCLRMRGALLALVGLVGLGVGCTGDIGDKGPVGTAEGPICTEGAVSPGPSPARRMTSAEYNATVRDLLGDTTSPASAFSAEEEAGGFNNNAYALVVTPTAAEKYMYAAEGVSRRATADVAALTGCTGEGDQATLEACAASFIDVFGTRALRRPLTTVEKEEFLEVFRAGVDLEKDPRSRPELQPPSVAGYQTGIQMIIETALQSPHFLYRIELGEGASPLSAGGTVVPVTSMEMASRLSYFLWGSMPDDELLAAGMSGALSTKEQIAEQARRMLESDKARDAVATFHRQWLDYDRIANVSKDEELFPDWSGAIGALMQEEMRAFIDHVVFDAEGDLGTLLSAPYTVAPGDLAAFYGAAGSGDQLVRVDFPAGQHAGLLTMGAIQAYYAHSNQTSPVHRGKLVREAILCGVIAPPPPNLVFELPMPDPNSTSRERFKQHATSACAGCHDLMDPIGFGFENFDSTGRYQSHEKGKPIDASGEIFETDVAGTFNGASELAAKLAASEDARACYAMMWFRWASGRGETEDDACTLEQLEQTFSESGANVKALLLALTQTDAFLYRTGGVVAGEPKIPGGS